MEDSGKRRFHELEHEIEDAASQTPLPHHYPSRIRSLRKGGITEYTGNPAVIAGSEDWETTAPAPVTEGGGAEMQP